MTTSTDQLTDEALVERIRRVQVEMGSINTRLEELADEINTRRNLFRDGRERWQDLNEELHGLVAVPGHPVFAP